MGQTEVKMGQLLGERQKKESTNWVIRFKKVKEKEWLYSHHGCTLSSDRVHTGPGILEKSWKIDRAFSRA